MGEIYGERGGRSYMAPERGVRLRGDVGAPWGAVESWLGQSWSATTVVCLDLREIP